MREIVIIVSDAVGSGVEKTITTRSGQPERRNAEVYQRGKKQIRSSSRQRVYLRCQEQSRWHPAAVPP